MWVQQVIVQKDSPETDGMTNLSNGLTFDKIIASTLCM